MTKFTGHCVLTLTLLSMSGYSQPGQKLDRRGAGNILATNELTPKGGIGIIIKNLYIDLTAHRNELVLDRGKRWDGRDSNSHEVVVFFDNQVWSTSVLPPEFNLDKAIIISFEGPVVRFFEFGRMSGGYYKRSKP